MLSRLCDSLPRCRRLPGKHPMTMNTSQMLPNQVADVRIQICRCLSNAISLAQDPATLFCIEPFNSVDEDGGGRLGRLLARAMRNPDRTALVVAEHAFVFAFADHLGRNDADRRHESTLGEEPPLSREAVI